jgi:hypothetical protein
VRPREGMAGAPARSLRRGWPGGARWLRCSSFLAVTPAPARRRACLSGGHVLREVGELVASLVPALDAAPKRAGSPAHERAPSLKRAWPPRTAARSCRRATPRQRWPGRRRPQLVCSRHQFSGHRRQLVGPRRPFVPGRRAWRGVGLARAVLTSRPECTASAGPFRARRCRPAMPRRSQEPGSPGAGKRKSLRLERAPSRESCAPRRRSAAGACARVPADQSARLRLTWPR